MLQRMFYREHYNGYDGKVGWYYVYEGLGAERLRRKLHGKLALAFLFLAMSALFLGCPFWFRWFVRGVYFGFPIVDSGLPDPLSFAWCWPVVCVGGVFGWISYEIFFQLYLPVLPLLKRWLETAEGSKIAQANEKRKTEEYARERARKMAPYLEMRRKGLANPAACKHKWERHAHFGEHHTMGWWQCVYCDTTRHD